MYGGRDIGRALDRATRPVAPTLSPDGYDGNGNCQLQCRNTLLPNGSQTRGTFLIECNSFKMRGKKIL